MSSDPRDLLPLAPQDFHVLLALLEAPRHAYGLSQAVDEEGAVVPSDERVRVTEVLEGLRLLPRAAGVDESGGFDVRRTLQREVVKTNQHAVFRYLQILFDIVRPLGYCQPIRIKGVFRRVG